MTPLSDVPLVTATANVRFWPATGEPGVTTASVTKPLVGVLVGTEVGVRVGVAVGVFVGGVVGVGVGVLVGGAVGVRVGVALGGGAWLPAARTANATCW